MLEGGSGLASASDGAVDVDSNVGTSESLAAELATEVAVVEADGRRGSKPATPAEGEGADGEPGAAKGAGGKKRQSIQARIDDITREKYTTQRERDEARAETAKLKAELEALKAGGGKVPSAAGEERPAEQRPAATGEKVGGVPLAAEKFPKYAAWLEAGNDGEIEDWVEARDEWKGARTAQAQALETSRREQSAAFTKTAATFNERMAPTLAAEPKFYERIDPRLTETPAASALPPGVRPTFGNFIVEQVVNSEYPRELMEYLSEEQNIQRLATLKPDAIIREIARFERTLDGSAATRSGPADRADVDDDEDDESSRAAAAVTATSRAHPPAKPVRGSSHEHSSPDEEPGEDASDDAWYRWERRRQTKAASA